MDVTYCFYLIYKRNLGQRMLPVFSSWWI